MLSSFRVFALALTLITGLIAAGCGADASLSPIGPSAGASSSGAVISGTVAGAGGVASTMSDAGGFTAQAAGSSIKVTVSGTNITSNTDSQGRFTLTGVPAGDVTLQFTGPGSSATVTLAGVSPSDRIDIKVTVNGNNGHVDSEHREHENKGVEANGAIAAIDAAARTLRIGTRQVSVPATATIRHGSRTLAFADLKVGDHIQVKGTMNGTVLVATEVKVEQGGDDHGDDDKGGTRNEVELTGAVSAREGTCPVTRLTVQTVRVATTATTTFNGVTCAAIANGTVVQVKGTRQTDGSVIATRVSRES